MLKNGLSLASVALLTSSVVWAGCSSDDDDDRSGHNSPTNDGGNGDRNDASSPGNNGDDDDDGNGDLPPPVDITYGTCSPVAKCASDIVGSWKVSGGCVDPSVFDDLRSSFGVEERDVVIKARGIVVATATTLERKMVVDLSATITVPKDRVPLNLGCAALGQGLTSGLLPGVPKFDEATCTDTDPNCDCAIKGQLNEDTSDDYTAADGVITTSDSTFDYCVEGNTAKFADTTESSGADFNIPIVVELTK